MSGAGAEALATAEEEDPIVRARRAWERGAADEALAVLRGAGQNGRHPFGAHMMAADIHRAVGDKEQEAIALGRALEIRPVNPWPYIGLGRLAVAAGRHGEAVALIEQALTRTSRQKDLRALLTEFAWVTSARCSAEVARPLGTVEGRAVQDAAMIAMVKDEEDIIFQQLRHHYLLGFRNFFVADNGSTDGTRAKIRAFRDAFEDAKVFVVDDPVKGYYQDFKTTALAHYAANIGRMFAEPIRWIFPLDADEFVTPCRGGADLKHLLEQLDGGAKKICMFELCDAASPEPLSAFSPDDDPFATFSLRSKFMAKPIPKVAFTYAPDVHVAMGNHYVDNVARGTRDVGVAALHGFVLTHFAIRSVAHAKSKFINGGRAYMAAPDRQAQHGRRWQKVYQLYQEHGESYFEDVVAGYIEGVRSTGPKSKPRSLLDSFPPELVGT